jgi:hypothetical protein
MAITREDLMRAGIGTGGMNPNVIPVQDMRISGVPAQQPMMSAPQEPQQRRGLLGGFFGPEGRDTRQRLAIALEGLALNPNQALIGQLQGDIEGRATDRQKNATVAWLLSRGRDDLAAAIEGGLPAADALRAALEPQEATGRVLDAAALRQMYPGAKIEEGLYSLKPDGTLTKVGGGGVNVNLPGQPTIGTIPPGYQAIQNPDGTYRYEAIPGGPVATEAATVEGQKSALAATAEDSIRLIDSIISDPALPAITGMLQGRLPPMTQAGTDLLAKIEQVQGQAFLRAFESLKGGGAITEREGLAAERAIARLQRSQSTDAMIESLKEFQTILDRGRRRAMAGVQAQDDDQFSGGSVINGVTVGEPIE